ncbi:hypothetical protein PSACC_01094 [Paramicrosporidium saccamoebae]|uniref:Uncharacterized protein n=1 Tax=Paramicrosporidium saccamoebae TaxID=1246581 RepID=A0A2H9TMZ5_9FUNG|nr:hypothetical protein PSACC_01094 [Paramicrosporidium saccamoebae]
MRAVFIQSLLLSLESLVLAAGNGLLSNNNNLGPSPIASNPIIERGDSYNPFATNPMDYPPYLGYNFGYRPDYRLRSRRRPYPYYPFSDAYRPFYGRNRPFSRARNRPHVPAYRQYRPASRRYEGVNHYLPNYFSDDYPFFDTNRDFRSLPSVQHGCAPLVPKGAPRSYPYPHPRPYQMPRNYRNWAYSDSSSSSDEEVVEYVWEY